MIITISGKPGSGKSSVAKLLVGRLKAKVIFVGDVRRKIAKEKGMTLSELNDYAETHPETDVDVDKKISEQAKKMEGDYVVVEGRTQFHFLPDSVKVFIKVALEVGADRIWKALQEGDVDRRNEGDLRSIEDVQKEIINRIKSDDIRYNNYYGIDIEDEVNYDLIIDSTDLTIEETVKKVIEFIKEKA